MSTGTTVQVIGAVVDVEFPAGQIPKVYDALVIDDAGVTLEVQQQLGDGVVRTIAMGSSEGLKRGMDVTNTGAPISVPVESSMTRCCGSQPASRVAQPVSSSALRKPWLTNGLSSPASTSQSDAGTSAMRSMIRAVTELSPSAMSFVLRIGLHACEPRTS